MAEQNSKGGILNKAEIFLRRRKTKVLQSLGKQGKTTDDILAEDCQRLEKQQEVASKFQKDLRHYVHSARALSAASKTFYSTVAETYEPDWENHAQITEILTNMDMLWQDYLQKLQEQVQEPLSKYLATIPQIKARVAKRGRKMIDYDNARHGLDVLQNAKKKDDAKIAKAQEDLDQAQKIYDDLNNELHHELPEFYNSRICFYGDLFQSLFSAENVFQSEAGKGSETISDSGSKLAKDHAHYTYTERKSVRSTAMSGDDSITNGHENEPESPQPDSPNSGSSPSSPTSPMPVSTPEPLTNGTADADTSKDSIEQDDYENAPLRDTKPSELVPAKDSDKSTAGEESEVKVESTETTDEADETAEEEKTTSEEKVKVKSSSNDCNTVKSTASIMLKHDLTPRELLADESSNQVLDVRCSNQQSESIYTPMFPAKVNISVDEDLGKEDDDTYEILVLQSSVDTISYDTSSNKRKLFGRQNTHEKVELVFDSESGVNKVKVLDDNDTLLNAILYETPGQTEDLAVGSSVTFPPVPLTVKKEEDKLEEVKVNGDLDTSLEHEVPAEAPPPVPSTPPPAEDNMKNKEEDVKQDLKQDLKVEKDKEVKENEESDDDSDSGLYQVPPPAIPVDNDLPKNYLYTVIATHAYKGEDDDELTFECNEVIYVVDYDDPEEQDPGWLMGVRKQGGHTGVFPENFTRKV